MSRYEGTTQGRSSLFTAERDRKAAKKSRSKMLDSVHQIDIERKKITTALKRLDEVEIDVKNQINFATVNDTL